MKTEARASIRTRYVGPTNYRPSRVTVSDDGGFRNAYRRLTWPWDYDLGVSENHAAAAQAWLDKHNPGNVVKGPGLGFENEYYWTWTEKKGGV